MNKKLIPLILTAMIAGTSTPIFAESVSFKLSVTIPEIVGITESQSQQTIQELAQTSSNLNIQVEKAFRNNEEILIKSIVVL